MHATLNHDNDPTNVGYETSGLAAHCEAHSKYKDPRVTGP